MIVAATTQQAIGVGIAVLMAVGWAIYLFATLRRRPNEVPGSEIELAPNRRAYFDDEAMEGPRLERGLSWALVLLAFTAIGLPLYWLKEPGRQAGADYGFDERSINRGRSLFLPTDSPEHGDHFNCAGCHGVEDENRENAAQGGSVAYTVSDFLGANRQVVWQAPALDTVLLRFDKEEVRNILIYGRPNTPMPAWGVEGGGPMNDQQIDDLVNYLESITLDGWKGHGDRRVKAPEEVEKLRARTRERLDTYREELAAGETYDEAKALFDLYCARCHTKGWSYGTPEVDGGGAFGPNLRGGVTLRQFPNRQEHVDFVTSGSDRETGYGTRGVGSGRMPGFGDRDVEGALVPGELTPEQIEMIVDYERGLE